VVVVNTLYQGEVRLSTYLKHTHMVCTVSDEEAIETARRLVKEEGLLVGTSSGANVFAALHIDNGPNRVVTVLPDRAERYFSTALL
jgi:cysteine synthase A